VKEFCIFAAHYVWPAKSLGDERLVLVLRLEPNQERTDALKDEISTRNLQLPDFKRVGEYLVWDRDFPRTASMKIRRAALAEEIRNSAERAAVAAL
jgi:long-chain acyl-CoA synthetase